MGFNAIVCPFDYVVKNIDKVQGLIITHGHEDHIGGVPYLLGAVGLKIYAGKMAKSLIEGKLKEHKNINKYEIIEYSDNTVLQSKYFTIDFFRVRHSIPDSFGVCLQTPSGKIVQTGDFRFDFLASGDQSNM
jgi:ribonuclease J